MEACKLARGLQRHPPKKRCCERAKRGGRDEIWLSLVVASLFHGFFRSYTSLYRYINTLFFRGSMFCCRKELHQTILAHNHNADLIKHHKAQGFWTVESSFWAVCERAFHTCPLSIMTTWHVMTSNEIAGVKDLWFSFLFFLFSDLVYRTRSMPSESAAERWQPARLSRMRRVGHGST